MICEQFSDNSSDQHDGCPSVESDYLPCLRSIQETQQHCVDRTGAGHIQRTCSASLFKSQFGELTERPRSSWLASIAYRRRMFVKIFKLCNLYTLSISFRCLSVTAYPEIFHKRKKLGAVQSDKHGRAFRSKPYLRRKSSWS